MEISAGTCIAVGVGVGGGVSHKGREEAELEGLQKEIQSNSAQTRRGANYAHMQWPWKWWNRSKETRPSSAPLRCCSKEEFLPIQEGATTKLFSDPFWITCPLAYIIIQPSVNIGANDAWDITVLLMYSSIEPCSTTRQELRVTSYYWCFSHEWSFMKAPTALFVLNKSKSWMWSAGQLHSPHLSAYQEQQMDFLTCSSSRVSIGSVLVSKWAEDLSRKDPATALFRTSRGAESEARGNYTRLNYQQHQTGFLTCSCSSS